MSVPDKPICPEPVTLAVTTTCGQKVDTSVEGWSGQVFRFRWRKEGEARSMWNDTPETRAKDALRSMLDAPPD